MVNHIERETELIQHIADIYDTQDAELISERHHDFIQLLNATSSFFRYKAAMDTLANQSRMACIYAPGDAYEQRNLIRNADINRRDAHNEAIQGVNTINRLYRKYGMEPMLDMSPADLAQAQNRDSVTAITLTYVEQANNASFHVPEKKQIFAQAKQDREMAQQERDKQVSLKTWQAMGQLTPGKEYLYDPQYAQAQQERDPNWVETKAEMSVQKNAQARREIEAKALLPELEEYMTTKTNPQDFQIES